MGFELVKKPLHYCDLQTRQRMSEVTKNELMRQMILACQHNALKFKFKGDDQEVLLVRQVFTHQDGSTATLHLVCSDWTCDYDAITATNKKRWAVEVFHQSLKSNASLAKSPTRTVRTRSNHVLLALCAAFKLECLSIQAQLNPFALCRMRLINASRIA